MEQRVGSLPVPTATRTTGAEQLFRVVYSPGDARGIYFGTAGQLGARFGGRKLFVKNEHTEVAARSYFRWKLPSLAVPTTVFL